MATNNNNLLASIDIGTKNTRVLFAMLEDDNTIQIEGYGKSISRMNRRPATQAHLPQKAHRQNRRNNLESV